MDSGTYTESINFQGKLITVKSIHGATKTKLIGSAGVTLVTFENGESFHASIEGFRMEGGSIAILCRNSAPTIRRNLLIDQVTTVDGAITLEGVTQGSTGGSAATIINNTIVNCSGSGIMDRSTVPPIIKNTIIVGSGTYGIDWNTAVIKPLFHPDLSYNDLWNNASNYHNVTDSGIGAISADPKFFGQFGLWAPFSPCIDAGDPDPLYNDPDGSRNDMGVYPYPEGGPLPGGGFKDASPTPREFALHQNFPNPFNPTTRISFELPVQAEWKLTIYNVMGQVVEQFSSKSDPGQVEVNWNASDYASGVYFYKLQAGEYTSKRKMMLLK
ncbi:MAG: T9SS type A sorting domain-containing protein [candidate division Zixibacteria bacterium]|nr:T9SS type A sorting domain-containing protein [candidate division Zixibacteria bacterium]